MTLPVLPMRCVDAAALGLSHAGLCLGEDADIFRRDPVPENYDNLRAAMLHAKQMIARAEELWGLSP